jgi:hypothetical protein
MTNEFRHTFPRIGRAHQSLAYQDGIDAGGAKARNICGRVDSAFGDHCYIRR